jgi:hypothetical protein
MFYYFYPRMNHQLFHFFLKGYLPIYFLLLLGYTAKINWSDGQWQEVLEADARGYYAYLPALFIYVDLNFGFYEKVEVQHAYDPNLIYDYRSNVEGNMVNKYFAGAAVLIAPFFLLAHATSFLLQLPLDGYAQSYMIALTLAALFYAFVGLVMLKKTLALFKISPANVCITVSATLFGTHLFYYSLDEVGMSHVYSFAMVCCFLFQVTSYFLDMKPKRIFYAAFFFGMLVLIRPINAIVLFSIPFLSNEFERFLKGIRRLVHHPFLIGGAVVIILAIGSLQLMIYFLQTGKCWIYSYGNEGFDFGSPQVFSFLFSYRKGFFLYTPLAFLSLWGLLAVWKNRFLFWSISLFLGLVVYVLSCWWLWHYGGGFSARVMVDYLPFFALLLAFLLEAKRPKFIRYLFFSCLVLTVVVNQIQILQYRYYIIHWTDMNKEKYWNVFLDIPEVLRRRN